MTNTQLSVVLPAKDEALCIGNLITEIHASLDGVVPFEIVITDDGSSDDTGAVARDTADQLGCALQLIRLRQSCGQSTAVHTGIRNAKGPMIATLDADGQNDPADIPAMLELARQQGESHFCIAGYRKKRKDTAWKRVQSKVANRVRAKLLGDGVPDTGCGLKLFPRDTFLAMPYFDHMHRYLPALTQRLGGVVLVHEVSHRERDAGVSKYTAWNRGWVGVVDILGVRWLQRRARFPQIDQVYCSNTSSDSGEQLRARILPIERAA
jgi:dolichol-phosphate mannosyltransferase